MRNLQTSDIFSACRLLSKIGIREEIKAVAMAAEENKNKRVKADMGVDLLLGILEKATLEKNEKEFYSFIANIFECDWNEVRGMDPIELLDKLQEVANIETWKNFFARVARLMKKK